VLWSWHLLEGGRGGSHRRAVTAGWDGDAP
jgi:hypothetical protein